MTNLGLSYSRGGGRSTSTLTNPQRQLLASVLAKKPPKRLAKALPGLVVESWRHAEALWRAVQEFPREDDEDGRLLARLVAVGFFAVPDWFLRRWFDAVTTETEWRRQDPKKWASFHARNPLFVEAGRAEAADYCGSEARFDQLMKVLS